MEEFGCSMIKLRTSRSQAERSYHKITAIYKVDTYLVGGLHSTEEAFLLTTQQPQVHNPAL